MKAHKMGAEGPGQIACGFQRIGRAGGIAGQRHEDGSDHHLLLLL
jgi:hypothetical protein